MKQIRFYFSGTEFIAYNVEAGFDFLVFKKEIALAPAYFNINEDELNSVPVLVNLEKTIMIAYCDAPQPADSKVEVVSDLESEKIKKKLGL